MENPSPTYADDEDPTEEEEGAKKKKPDKPTSVSVLLKTPAKVGGDEKSTLIFSPPSTRMIIQIGPVMEMRIEVGDDDEEDIPREATMSVNYKRLARYIAKLGGIPLKEVDRMDPDDFYECQEKLMPFLMASAKGLPTDTADL